MVAFALQMGCYINHKIMLDPSCFVYISYYQSKIDESHSRSELHYMLISFGMSCVTMQLLDKTDCGSE